MPYTKVSELPQQVKVLPIAARLIWMRAFNSALKQGYKEEIAFRVAWGAVKRIYVKKGNKWVKRKPK